MQRNPNIDEVNNPENLTENEKICMPIVAVTAQALVGALFFGPAASLYSSSHAVRFFCSVFGAATGTTIGMCREKYKKSESTEISETTRLQNRI